MLAARIDARFDAMLEQDALEEVRELMSLKLDSTLPVMRALGVAALIAHLRGELTLDEAVTRIKTESRQYAKRQMTWARRNMISWNEIKEQDSKSLVQKIFSFMDV